MKSVLCRGVSDVSELGHIWSGPSPSREMYYGQKNQYSLSFLEEWECQTKDMLSGSSMKVRLPVGWQR